MLALVLKILSIIGILLLILLGICLTALLLVLFWPIAYRAAGQRTSESMSASFRARWFFGLVRAKYDYPVPNRFTVKVLWFTLFDSSNGISQEAAVPEAGAQEEASSDKEPPKASAESVDTGHSEDTAPKTGVQEEASQGNTPGTKSSIGEKIAAKYHKILYTIRSIYDKIKHVLKEWDYYRRLLQDEETQKLFSHACKRIGKVLRHLRPRRIRADITFGTGSPDTTGYAYGIYGMFSPKLGKHITVVPDFTQAILVGNADLKGHVTLCSLLFNGLALMLDKRLKLFISRLKKHAAGQKKQMKAQ